MAIAGDLRFLHLHVNFIIMFAKKISFAIFFSFFQCLRLREQKMDVIPMSVPEEVDVSATRIISFIDAAGKSKTEFQNFIFQ